MKPATLFLCLLGIFMNAIHPTSTLASAIDDTSPRSFMDTDIESLTSSPRSSLTLGSFPPSVSFAQKSTDGETMLTNFSAYLAKSADKPSHTFRHINASYEVNLVENHLEIRGHMPASFLEAYPHAKRVSLSGAQEVPLALLSPELEELSLYGCDLTLDDGFMEALGRFPALTSLVIVGKRYFPHIIRGSGIKGRDAEVDWGHAPMHATFTSFAPVPNLRTLRLESMKFTHLPEDICLLSRLETLSLRNNFDLGDLPSKMRGLRTLTHLDLRDTHIHAVPLWIGELKTLEHLGLGYMDDALAHVPQEWSTKGLVHEEAYRGMPPNLTFEIPKELFKKMPGLLIALNEHAAMPYLESALKNGFVATTEYGLYQIPQRKKHRSLSYLAKALRG